MVSGGARPGKAGRHASFLHKTDPWQAWLATRHPTPPHPIPPLDQLPVTNPITNQSQTQSQTQSQAQSQSLHYIFNAYGRS